jgi:DNA-binding CsgD family transcriptional regulator
VAPVLDEIAAGTGKDETRMRVHLLTVLLQAAIAVQHRGAASVLMANLDSVAELSMAWTAHTCLARHLGDAAVMLGERAAARRYYAQALEAAGKIRFRPELALTHLQLTELLLGDGEGAEALQHLNIALPELRVMHMQPALERAQALSEKLGSAAAHAPLRSSESDGLTAREQEIARLVADGRSNREIAATLVITEGTVEVHVKHIMSKLRFRSRTQVAGWFARQESA